jgi:hypothetical protein
MAKKLAKEGSFIKMLPEHKGKGIKGWKNPDYLINANLWELESVVGTKSSIDRAIRKGQQQALNLVIQVPRTADRSIVLNAIYARFTHRQYPASARNLTLYHGDRKDQWTADQIRRWARP